MPPPNDSPILQDFPQSSLKLLTCFKILVEKLCAHLHVIVNMPTWLTTVNMAFLCIV